MTRAPLWTTQLTQAAQAVAGAAISISAAAAAVNAAIAAVTLTHAVANVTVSVASYVIPVPGAATVSAMAAVVALAFPKFPMYPKPAAAAGAAAFAAAAEFAKTLAWFRELTFRWTLMASHWAVLTMRKMVAAEWCAVLPTLAMVSVSTVLKTAWKKSRRTAASLAAIATSHEAWFAACSS